MGATVPSAGRQAAQGRFLAAAAVEAAWLAVLIWLAWRG